MRRSSIDSPRPARSCSENCARPRERFPSIMTGGRPHAIHGAPIIGRVIRPAGRVSRPRWGWLLRRSRPTPAARSATLLRQMASSASSRPGDVSAAMVSFRWRGHWIMSAPLRGRLPMSRSCLASWPATMPKIRHRPGERFHPTARV